LARDLERGSKPLLKDKKRLEMLVKKVIKGFPFESGCLCFFLCARESKNYQQGSPCIIAIPYQGTLNFTPFCARK
jgi:hypothetical protein